MRTSMRLRVLLLLVVLGLGAPRAFAAPVVSIGSFTGAATGDVFSVDVRISDVTDLFALQFDVGFDPAILSVLNVAEGGFLPGGGATFFLPGTVDNALGSVANIADSLLGALTGVSGSGTVATINFRALGPGDSPLVLSNLIVLDSTLLDITTGTSAGAVAVPEPRAWLLLLIGCAGLLYARRDPFVRRV
jgi:hypothetical protein